MKVTLSSVLVDEQAKALAFHADVLGFVMKLDLPAGEYPAEHATPSLTTRRWRRSTCASVAVLDVDHHHGNGTQDIFWERADVLVVSLHGTPETEYPHLLGYASEGFTHNFPLPRGTTWAQYSATLSSALDAVARFGPDALVVSLGGDTYVGDPISAFALKREHFPLMGRSLAQLRLPTVFVLEGGYAVEDLGPNASDVLGGFDAGR